jgi:hypothetical protein
VFFSFCRSEWCGYSVVLIDMFFHLSCLPCLFKVPLRLYLSVTYLESFGFNNRFVVFFQISALIEDVVIFSF